MSHQLLIKIRHRLAKFLLRAQKFQICSRKIWFFFVLFSNILKVLNVGKPQSFGCTVRQITENHPQFIFIPFCAMQSKQPIKPKKSAHLCKPTPFPFLLLLLIFFYFLVNEMTVLTFTTYSVT